MESGIPVEGKVTGSNAGGFEVKIGTLSAFCPISLIDRQPITDAASFVGRTLDFNVIEAADRVILSRRALL